MGEGSTVVIRVDAREKTPEELLIAFNPIVDRFSQWMSQHTIVPQPLIRSERELIRQFLLWLSGDGHAEDQPSSEDQDPSLQVSDS
jgi:hypothetical protein